MLKQCKGIVSKPELFGKKVTLKKFTQKSKNKISSRTEKGYNKYYNMSVRGDKTSKNTDR